MEVLWLARLWTDVCRLCNSERGQVIERHVINLALNLNSAEGDIRKSAIASEFQLNVGLERCCFTGCRLHVPELQGSAWTHEAKENVGIFSNDELYQAP